MDLLENERKKTKKHVFCYKFLLSKGEFLNYFGGKSNLRTIEIYEGAQIVSSKKINDMSSLSVSWEERGWRREDFEDLAREGMAMHGWKGRRKKLEQRLGEMMLINGNGSSRITVRNDMGKGGKGWILGDQGLEKLLVQRYVQDGKKKKETLICATDSRPSSVPCLLWIMELFPTQTSLGKPWSPRKQSSEMTVSQYRDLGRNASLIHSCGSLSLVTFPAIFTTPGVLGTIFYSISQGWPRIKKTHPKQRFTLSLDPFTNVSVM